MPIGEIPILEIILCQLRNSGFRHVSIACGYLAELIQAYLLNNRISTELQIDFFREQKPLGTAGALRNVEGLGDTFLVMNGDILTTLDYRALMTFHREREAALTIATTPKKVEIELGVLHLDQEGRVTGYEEKPVKEFPASTGIYIYEPRVLTHIPPDAYLDFPALVMKLLSAGERVVSYPVDGFWLDMGNKGEYERAVKAFEADRKSFNVD
jgi:NDP-sugar pyrophosphorylase family protein